MLKLSIFIVEGGRKDYVFKDFLFFKLTFCLGIIKPLNLNNLNKMTAHLLPHLPPNAPRLPKDLIIVENFHLAFRAYPFDSYHA